MKKFLMLAIASIIIGFIAFAIFFWLLSFDKKESMIMGIVAAVTGLVVEYLRPLLHKLEGNRESNAETR